jgi:predicted RNA-binding protein with PIN domain
MSRHYIIDGYNVLHSSSRWDRLPRAQQREVFLRYLESERHIGSPRNSLTVVLDGYRADVKKIQLEKIRLVFSEDRDADSVIKERVADLANPREAVVVTNDRGIQNAVKALGAQVMACEEFLLLKKKRAVIRYVEKMEAPNADAINSELKRFWKLD